MTVAFDAVGPAGGGGAGSSPVPASPGSVTWAHVCTGSELVLYVGVFVGTNVHADSDFTITGVTYNSVSMTQVGSTVHSGGSTTGCIRLYRLIAPATGSNTVSVNYTFVNGTTNDALGGGSVSFTGVNQSTPEQNFTSADSAHSASTPSSVTQASSTGNMILAMVGAGDALSSPNQTGRWLKNINAFSSDGNSAMQTANGASSVNFTWTVAGPDFWGTFSVDIIASGNSYSDSVSINRTLGIVTDSTQDFHAPPGAAQDYYAFPKVVMRNGGRT